MTTSVTGFCTCDPVNASGNYASAGAFRAEATYSKVSDIVIETLEGDKVTLSSSAYTSGGYETYKAFAMGMGTAAWHYGESAYFESKHDLSLSITGDLSKEELDDINKILRTLDRMMNDLAAGDLEGVLAESAGFRGIDSIASFSADMSITTSIAVGRYETAAASIPFAGAEKGSGYADGRIDRAADAFAGALNARTASIKELVSALEDYFSDWFEKRSDEANSREKGTKWASRFARRLMNGLERADGGGGEEEAQPPSRPAAQHFHSD
jgi:hypothetical protein